MHEMIQKIFRFLPWSCGMVNAFGNPSVKWSVYSWNIFHATTYMLFNMWSTYANKNELLLKNRSTQRNNVIRWRYLFKEFRKFLIQMMNVVHVTHWIQWNWLNHFYSQTYEPENKTTHKWDFAGESALESV